MRQPVPFGKYLLLDRISVGGMAEVFKAKSYGVEGFEKIIAIKRILPTMGEDRDFIKMFIDEAKIAGQLAHANICQIFELGRIDGAHFIAMEYIWGKDLLQIQNRLRKLKQPMQIPMACFLIAKVLEGLDYAHRKRDPLGRPLEIVHRDCSPQNVLISYEGEVKVIDFGIAKATSRNSRTMAGVLKGKFGYMSPEQVRGLPLDRRSDIFALGTMLYECLTSERLFQGETDFSTLEKVRNVDIANPRAVNPNIPEHVERVILKALAKDVDERYQWCSEMLADIQQFLMSQDVVFTAKSLSSWLKEGFAPEIDRERGQLEQYKRVGRDGLIQGVPAAESKASIVESLGAAPAPEGDATQLGGPDIEAMNAAANAAAPTPPPPSQPKKLGRPATGPSPLVKNPPPPAASPAAVKAPAKPLPAMPPRHKTSSEDDGEFGEEAPTEIFGDGDGNSQPAIVHSPAPRASSKGIAAPTRPTPQPSEMPRAPNPTAPMPPPGQLPAPPQQQPMQPSGAMAAQPIPSQQMHAMPQQQQPDQQNPYAYQQPTAIDPNAYPDYANHQMAMGTPGAVAMPQQMNGLASGMQPPAKTLMGQPAPPGLGQYQGGYRPITQPGMAAPPPPQMTPQAMSQQYPSQQYPQQYPYAQNPSGNMQAYGQNPYSQQQPQMLQTGPGGYPSYPMAQMPMGVAAPALEQAVPGPVVEGRKRKSTLVRDILIGVLIAAVVLGGFLVLKMFVLDGGDSSEPVSTIANVKLKLPAGVTAALYVDDKTEPEYKAVVDGQEVTLTAGKRKIRIQAPQGKCDITTTLPGGETTTLQCDLKGAGGSGSSSDNSGSGSADDDKVAVSDKKPVESPRPDAGKPAAPPLPDSTTKPGDPAKVTIKPADPKPADPKPPVDQVKKPDVKPADPAVKKVDPPKVDPPKVDPPKTDPKKDKLPPEDTSATAGDKGNLTISSKPAAKIVVDGGATGLSTPCKLTLAAGKHKITFLVGEDKYSFNIVVKAGATTDLTKDFQ